MSGRRSAGKERLGSEPIRQFACALHTRDTSPAWNARCSDRGPCPEGVGTALLSLTVKPNDVAHGTHGPAQCPVCRIGSTSLVETDVNRGPSGAPLRLVSVWSVPPRYAFRPGLVRPSDSRPSWESLCLSLPRCLHDASGVGWAAGGYEQSDWQPVDTHGRYTHPYLPWRRCLSWKSTCSD